MENFRGYLRIATKYHYSCAAGTSTSHHYSPTRRFTFLNEHHDSTTITADPHHAIILGNYAQVLFAKSDDVEAINLTEKAISFASDDERPLLTECHFYLFAPPKHRKESGRVLKKLLADGATTGGWSFEMNLERLQREEDPRLELLEAVAQTLGDGDTSRLDAFEEWRDL